MWKKWGFFFLSVLIGISLSTTAFAAGFALYETGARGTALGGAMIARADDPSALYFNPAGITQLPGTQTLFGLTMIAPRFELQTTGQIGYAGAPPARMGVVSGTQQTTTSLEDNYFWPPHAYITYALNEKVWLGLGVFSRFGLGVEFPTNWPGRYNSYNAKIVTSEANPNIAYKVSDNFSISAGLSMMYFDVKLQKKIAGNALSPFYTNDIDQKLTGDSFGFGYNFGLHYKPTEWISFGASYRSKVTQHIEGDLEFRGQVDATQRALFPNVSGDATLVLPDQLFLGVAVKPMKKLSVEVGAILTNWSSYDELKLELDSPILGTRNVVATPKNWKNAWRYHVGLEYNVTDWMDVRLSYIYDESPVPDETIAYELPDSDRNVFGIGLGFHKNNWSLDLHYNHLLFSDREIAARPNEGILATQVQDGVAYIAGISFGYKF